MSDRRFQRRDGSLPYMMGILNVTPDSFSDGGNYYSKEDALAHAFDLVDQGADIIDIGGESTRPGSQGISSKEEMSRVIPVLYDLVPSIDVPLSVDTSKSDVAEAALNAGATILNDIWGLRNEGMMDVAASFDAQVVIMYMYGSPVTLADETAEGNIIDVINDFFAERISSALDAGVRSKNIILDPGIGFGLTSEQSMQVIANLSSFPEDYPILVGPSRKRFLADCYPGMDRDAATAEVSVLSAENGADILRVHDVLTVRNRLMRR